MFLLAPLLLNMFSWRCAWPSNASSLMPPSWQHGATPTKDGEARGETGKTRAGKGDGQRKQTETQRLWGMLYADDASISSRSLGGLENAMAVVATAIAAFGLTVSEAKPVSCSGK